MKRICVYCGSSKGKNPSYTNSAKKLGKLFVKENIGLVYGGGGIGLMGVIADTIMELGGEVTGVITQALFDRELAKKDITKLYVVESMHERKAKMAELSDAFIALPGGIGTLEEFAEAVTWLQLGIQNKPCGILNVDGYYDDLIKFLERANKDGFFRHLLKSYIMVSDTSSELIEKLRTCQLNTAKSPHWREGLE